MQTGTIPLTQIGLIMPNTITLNTVMTTLQHPMRHSPAFDIMAQARIVPVSLGGIAEEGLLFDGPVLRRASRHGAKKAIVASAHQVLIIAFHLIRDGGVYREIGGEYFDQLNPERT